MTLSIAETVAAIVAGETTATELATESLDHIEATDSTIGAFASVQAAAALERAATLDALPDAERGPLHGIPVALKDLIFTEGVPAVANCDALSGFVPDFTATVAQRLTDAGATVIGKTNTHELAFGVSCPASRNPWDQTRMTGGSSGGSAAAIAAGQVLGALGTDTGGSVRIPSNYCGTTGIKTTRGLVPRDGIHLLSWTYDTVGPMARTAEDCRILLEALSGPTTADPYSISTPMAPATDPSELRLGMPTDGWLANAPMHPEVLATLHRAANVLADLVSTSTSIELPSWEEHAGQGSAIVFAEAAALTSRIRGEANDRIGEETRGILEMGAASNAVDLAIAQDVRRQLEADWNRVFDNVDVVICPVTPNHVLDHGIDELYGMPLIPATTQFTFAINGAGLPAIALPGGIGSDGLPIGFQLIGRPFSELTLAAVGEAFQAATNHHDAVPTDLGL